MMTTSDTPPSAAFFKAFLDAQDALTRAGYSLAWVGTIGRWAVAGRIRELPRSRVLLGTGPSQAMALADLCDAAGVSAEAAALRDAADAFAAAPTEPPPAARVA